MSTNPQPTPGLRERVAELMGWRTEGNWIISPDGKRGNVLDGWDYPPFDSDLNHAHAACRALLVTREHWRDFFGHLEDVTTAEDSFDWVDCFKCSVFATPEEICTALLRTLGGEEGACRHNFQVSSPIDTVEVCIKCGKRQSCEPIIKHP